MTTPDPLATPDATGTPAPAGPAPETTGLASPPPAEPTGAATSPVGSAPPPYGAMPPPGAPAYGSTPPPGAPAYGATPPAGGMPPGAPPTWTPGAPWPDRRESQQPGLVFGIILVAVGAIFLALRLGNIALGPDAWPLWLIIPGLAMLVGSLFIPSRGGLGLAIPGTILAIVGGIIWVQATYDLYATWAYAWALVAPTGPGLAMLLYGLVHGDGDLARDGLGTTLTGIGLFLGFGLFFEGVIGISGHRIDRLDEVLPYAAIGLGILLIVLAFVEGGRRDQLHDQRRAQRHAEKEQRRAERRTAKAARRAAR